jgi:hypothetical protein
MIYVDAGTDQGLAKGATLEFRRDGALVSSLSVTSLSSKRSACAAPENHDIHVGDKVTFQAVAPSRALEPAPQPSPTPLHFPETEEVRRGRIPGIWRGRVGLRFMARADAMATGTDTYQPALDLRADAANFGREDVSLKFDIRTRRTFTSSATTSRSNGRTRVHRAGAEWRRPDSPWSVTAGRQFVSAISSVGTLDGVALQYEGLRWSAGVLSGTQPDPTSYGFSTEIVQHGIFVARNSGPGSDTRWRAALALLGAYEGGKVHREHMALQGRWNRGRLFTTALQEVDINRDWRATQESSLSLTSSFWTARVQATEKLSFSSGFDARRNLRLYRDTITPETEFDDSYRRGYWSGVAFRPYRSTRISLDGRRSSGGSGGSANSATARLRVAQPRWWGIALSSRHTIYDNQRALGLLQSVSTGIDVGSRTRVEGTWGTRQERNRDITAAGGETSNDATWWSMELEAYVFQGWYLLADVERSAGDREDNVLYFLSAIRRFQ